MNGIFDITCVDKNGTPIEHFTQWDTKQVIYIRNTGLTEAPIVHFCNAKSKEAIGMKSLLEDGVVICEVPNEILTEDLRVYVYLYKLDVATNKGTNVHIGKFEVVSKKKPRDYVLEKNVKVVNLIILDGQVQALILREKQITSDILALQEADKGINSSIKTINNNVATNAANILALQKADTSFKNTYDARVIEVNTAIAALESKDASIDANIKTITTNIGTNASKITAIESAITDIEASISTTNTNVAANTTEIGGLKEVDATHKSLIDQNTADIKTLSDFMSNYELAGTAYSKTESDQIYAAKSAEHTHQNADILNGITSEKIALWDTAGEIEVDTTLTKSGKAADAAVVGENVYYSDYIYSSTEPNVELTLDNEVIAGNIIKITVGQEDVSVTKMAPLEQGGSLNIEQIQADLLGISHAYIEVTDEYTTYKISNALSVSVISQYAPKKNIAQLKDEVEELKAQIAILTAQIEALTTT